MTPKSTWIHLLTIALAYSIVVVINASSSEHPLRAHDRDVFSLLRSQHPDLLLGLDLSSTVWHRTSRHLVAMDLSGVDLRSLRLGGRSLKNMNLQGSHLEQAEFNCVPMENVNFAGANLKEVHFNYAKCKKDNDQKDIELTGNFNGADLSGSAIHGGDGGEKPDPQKTCKYYLTIKANLNGAKFTGATLRCINLINTSHLSKATEQSYGGINFVNAVLDDVNLVGGGFQFSDFYKAQVLRLDVNPEVDFRFSTLADLKCGREPNSCEVVFKPQIYFEPTAHGLAAREKKAWNTRLSVNVRGSRIRSNLQLPNSKPGWPALLCDRRSKWEDNAEEKKSGNQPGDISSANQLAEEGARFWIVKKDKNSSENTPTCEPL